MHIIVTTVHTRAWIHQLGWLRCSRAVLTWYNEQRCTYVVRGKWSVIYAKSQVIRRIQLCHWGEFIYFLCNFVQYAAAAIQAFWELYAGWDGKVDWLIWNLWSAINIPAEIKREEEVGGVFKQWIMQYRDHADKGLKNTPRVIFQRMNTLYADREIKPKTEEYTPWRIDTLIYTTFRMTLHVHESIDLFVF